MYLIMLDEVRDYKLALADLSIEDQESIESIYPLNSDSARIAVAFLQDYYMEAISQHPGAETHRKVNVIAVKLDSVCRLVDLKHPLDQIIYQKDNLTYSPRKFEAHFFPDQLKLTTFFDHLKQKRIRNEFILVINGIDPSTSDQDVIKSNLHLCQGKVNMADWTSLSAVTSWKVVHESCKIEQQSRKIEAQSRKIEKQDKEIQILRKQPLMSEKSAQNKKDS